MRAHHEGTGQDQIYIEGVIIYGEGKSHTGKNNGEVNKIRIDLDEFMDKVEFANKEQATKIMIKEINFSHS